MEPPRGGRAGHAPEGLERREAHVQLAEPPRMPVRELDVVANRDGPVEQDDDAGDEVGGDALHQRGTLGGDDGVRRKLHLVRTHH